MDIDQKIQQALQNYQRFSLKVPRHVHTGGDSPQIPITNLLISPGIGLPLFNGSSGYNFFITTGGGLSLVPNTTVIAAGNNNFSIGTSIFPFKEVSIYTTADILETVNDGTHVSTEKLTSTLKQYTATGNFAVELPTSTAPSPVKGMYYFDGANFKAVDGSGTFKFIPTSAGTSTVGTVPIGTIDLIINGVTYNVLHT